ncbi:AraC family transcriptional regulator [Falsochrobactrum sp. TDYN1]|uniref:AraC family transcriptional regulator n=2 Tax=Falsochrobactrum tianjinense TaxID=2706015 RepID=A0A949PL81_9HYPH|nr:AraC family transcriptional regulator [Falsochrobactrum sp. TDYN1]
MQSRSHSVAGPLIGNEDHQGVTSATQSSGPFRYGLTRIGIDVYTPEKKLAIILLEPVRHLRWRDSEGGDHSASCPAGTIFYIPAHYSMVITWPEAVQFLSVTVDETDDTILSSTRIPASTVRFSSKQCLQISEIILEQLQEVAADNANYLSSLYSVLVNLLMRNAQVAQTAGGAQSGLSAYACGQIETYLKTNFRNPVSVPEMAATLGISAGHFATCFRESFGQTPHQYLMKLRLDEAERCLCETDMPISEIAARLSFSSQSHLTTALRKHRQLTPGEIRRRGRQQRLR